MRRTKMVDTPLSISVGARALVRQGRVAEDTLALETPLFSRDRGSGAKVRRRAKGKRRLRSAPKGRNRTAIWEIPVEGISNKPRFPGVVIQPFG